MDIKGPIVTVPSLYFNTAVEMDKLMTTKNGLYLAVLYLGKTYTVKKRVAFISYHCTD